MTRDEFFRARLKVTQCPPADAITLKEKPSFKRRKGKDRRNARVLQQSLRMIAPSIGPVQQQNPLRNCMDDREQDE